MSLSAVLIMIVTLFTLGAVVFSNAVLQASLTQLRQKVDVNVYFMTNAPESDILALKSSLEKLPEVASVEYIPREKALADFKERHRDDQTIINALAELEDNPLGAVFNVKAHETSQYEAIATYLTSDAAVGSGNQVIIQKLNYNNNKPIIEKLIQVIDSSESIGFALSIILILLSAIITFNTVHLTIYTAREEISVMRLVGASSAYARGPFVVEGIMYGIAAALIVMIVYYPLTLWMGPFTERFFGAINIFDYYVSNFGQIFLILMAAGIGLGGISSYMAVRRYLQI